MKTDRCFDSAVELSCNNSFEQEYLWSLVLYEGATGSDVVV